MRLCGYAFDGVCVFVLYAGHDACGALALRGVSASHGFWVFHDFLCLRKCLCTLRISFVGVGLHGLGILYRLCQIDDACLHLSLAATALPQRDVVH